MRTHRYLLPAVLVAGLALVGCGGDEPPPKGQPPAPPKIPPVPAGSVPVGCIGKWTSGTSGTLTCIGGGPNKDRIKIDSTSFRLDKICVNDKRIASFKVAGGTAVPIPSKPEGTMHCADFAAVQQLPESCSCVAPPGGDCNPPPDGFICLATGHVPM